MITFKYKEKPITVHRYELIHDEYGLLIVDDYWRDGHMGMEIYDRHSNRLTDNNLLFEEVMAFLEETGL